jgi:3-hydroxyisobutyrate dehydrogenase-like beta-hydroxyacid dehydrogenase
MGAAKATLALIAGGDPSVIERCRPALETMGTIYPCGAVGMGMVAKLANNAVGLLTIPLVREARAMAAAHGMDMDTLMTVMRAGTANSFIVQAWNWVEAYGEKGAPVALKDLLLFRETAGARGIATPILDNQLAQAKPFG